MYLGIRFGRREEDLAGLRASVRSLESIQPRIPDEYLDDHLADMADVTDAES
jgi:hypothetical protein